jgi:hypothetical protein
MSYHIWEVKRELYDLTIEKSNELSALRKEIDQLNFAMNLIVKMEGRIDERKLEDPDKLKKELLDFSDVNWDEDPNVD